MSKIILSNLSFKPVEKKRKSPTNNGLRKISKKVYCICIEKSPNEFVAHINMKHNDNFIRIRELPFTERSYDLKGKLKVFSVIPDKYNKITCIIRDKLTAVNFPGLDLQYTPFRNNYVYSGYIVNDNGKHYFDVEDVYENFNYCRYLIDDEILKTNNETK